MTLRLRRARRVAIQVGIVTALFVLPFQNCTPFHGLTSTTLPTLQSTGALATPPPTNPNGGGDQTTTASTPATIPAATPAATPVPPSPTSNGSSNGGGAGGNAGGGAGGGAGGNAGGPPTASGPFTADGCFLWDHSIESISPLQQSINANACVEVRAGLYQILAPINLPAGHTLRGQGAAVTTIKVVPETWAFGAGDGLVSSIESQSKTVSDLTLDGSGAATYAVVGLGITADRIIMINNRCSGVGIGGPGIVITNSVIRDAAWGAWINGRFINCASGGGGVDDGAAIYGQNGDYAPVIQGNTITHNRGPALDMNRVSYGKLLNNRIFGNTAWAAVSIFGGSGWVIDGNDISHPSDQPQQAYHVACQGGPGGSGKSAAVILCEESDQTVVTANVVSNNHLASYFGILSIGAKSTKAYLVPRFNKFIGNDVNGSNIGCADNYTPGQWIDGDNLWSGNNCQGTPDSAPAYF